MSFAISDEDRDVMTKRAARLMGRQDTAPSSAPIQSAITVAFTALEKTPVPQITLPEFKVTPPATTTALVRTTKENVVPAPLQNAGPRLQGTTDQLAAAREFLQGATSGGAKGRPGRQRLLSKRVGRMSFSSSSSSPRASTASLGTSAYGPPLISTPPRTIVRSQDSTPPPSLTFTPRTNALWQVGTGPMLTPANSPNQAGDALAADPVMKKENEVVKDVTASLDKMGTSDSYSSTASAAKENRTQERHAEQLTDTTNILTRSTAGFMPPHLRAKINMHNTTDKHENSESIKKMDKEMLGDFEDIAAAAAAAAGCNLSSDGSATESRRIIDLQNPKIAAPRINGLRNGSVDTAKNETKSATTEEVTKPAEIAEPGIKPAIHNGSTGSANAQASTATTTSVDQDDTLRLLHVQLEEVVKRVTNLERDNFAMQKHVEAMMQVHERRNFLGTDSPKAPFAVEVNCPNGTVYKVQTDAEMKVSDLIRRVRVQADLATTATKNPRLSVDGQQVGHSMTMAEAGVAKGKMAVFSYDAAE